MIASSKIKQKSKAILGVIRNLILYFIFDFVTVYIIWESTLYMQHEHKAKDQIHYASLEEVKKFYDKQFTTVYNVNTHCNLLYELNRYTLWNCLNFIRKRRLICCYLLRSDV